jgi:hypothetical protein
VAIRRLIVFAATCVFAKQSLEPILCGLLPLSTAWIEQVPEAPLLPKLRGHFAEFLFHGSLEHLRLLASPTCVGLRYGRSVHSPTGLFSAASSTALGQASLALGVRSHLQGGFRPPQTTPLHRDVQHPTAPSLPRPPAAQHTLHGTGIFARFPSPTPLGLGLGAG